jgi:LacI family transcriptional regulator
VSKPTIKDIAKATAVNISTVSRAINKPWMVREEVRTKILHSVAELGYKPNNIARSFRRGESDVRIKTKNIALVVPHTNSFRAHCCGKNIFTGIEQTLRARQYNLAIVSWPENDPIPSIFVNREVDGAIASYLSYKQTSLLAKNIPLVSADTWHPKQVADMIVSDNEGASYQAARYLLKKGHKHIGLLGHTSSPRGGFCYELYQGHARAMAEKKMKIDRKLLYLPGNLEPDKAYNIVNKILTQPNPPTALISNDECAIAAIRASLEHDLKIPDDMAIIGIDGIDMGGFIHPPLTTVSLNMEEIGKRAVKQIFQRIKNPNEPFVTIRINSKLVIRKSV